jgi:hypothetical protein
MCLIDDGEYYRSCRKLQEGKSVRAVAVELGFKSHKSVRLPPAELQDAPQEKSEGAA